MRYLLDANAIIALLTDTTSPIAGQAKARELTLVTHNTTEFAPGRRACSILVGTCLCATARARTESSTAGNWKVIQKVDFM
jgi:hypothetical protein